MIWAAPFDFHTTQAVHRADEATARERAAAAKLLSKEAEVGQLKGETASLRSSLTSRLDQQASEFKVRMHDVEAKLAAAREENAALRNQKMQQQQRGPGASLGPAGVNRQGSLDEEEPSSF